MPKATVTINLPDGWELADTKMRPPKIGEWFIGPAGSVMQAGVNYTTPFVIVRRIADQYVNVRLRREVAQSVVERFVADSSTVGQVTAACAEALREQNEPCPFWRHEHDRSRWCNPPHDFDWRCALPAGHAGEHGV